MKTIKMEIPKWAEWKKTKPTHVERCQQLIEELPKGYRFYSQLVHDKLKTEKGFKDTSMRRTHEALKTLEERGILFHDSKKRDFFVSVSGNKVKLYEVV